MGHFSSTSLATDGFAVMRGCCGTYNDHVDITDNTSLHAYFAELKPSPFESSIKFGLDTIFMDG